MDRLRMSFFSDNGIVLQKYGNLGCPRSYQLSVTCCQLSDDRVN